MGRESLKPSARLCLKVLERLSEEEYPDGVPRGQLYIALVDDGLSPGEAEEALTDVLMAGKAYEATHHRIKPVDEDDTIGF